MLIKILIVLSVFCLIGSSGNFIKNVEKEKSLDESDRGNENEGKVSKRGLAAAIPLIELGVTVLQSVLEALGNIERKIAIGIGNNTPYEWRADGVYFRSGTSDEFLPASVSSDEGAIFPARKTSGPVATGVVGVLCYYIPKKQKSLCVMFSVPFDYNLHSNWWNVKMFSGRKSPDQGLYENLYYSKPYKGDNRYHTQNLGYGFIMEEGIMNSAGNARLLINIAEKN
ncbi:DELTA-stichotoxin-She4b-like [Dendronephthya gigantea]|uniref:DELTA-stichotoxin-She4b-like n=1 Tax=Dendronephthya gigantea TaxID=151771 RepID=UPI0010696C30|nr:DELTA-stichotoxin-She4b-like [Dendronephthya gigantea]